MAFAVNPNWTCYFMSSICSQNWASCLNKMTRCFVVWNVWHLTDDFTIKKKPKQQLSKNNFDIHKWGYSYVPSSQYFIQYCLQFSHIDSLKLLIHPCIKLDYFTIRYIVQILVFIFNPKVIGNRINFVKHFIGIIDSSFEYDTSTCNSRWTNR